jgi:hypothetical protein
MPLDVFLWGCVEDYIYRTSVDVSATLHARIMKAKKCWWDELVYLPDAVRVTRDFHVEVEQSTHRVLNEGTVRKRLHISLHFICHIVNV